MSGIVPQPLNDGEQCKERKAMPALIMCLWNSDQSPCEILERECGRQALTVVPR